MGCDIHFTVERELGCGWVGVYSTEYSPHLAGGKAMEKLERVFVDQVEEESWEDNVQYHYSWPSIKNRHYEFFAALAGVRGDGPEPNGIPADASELTHMARELWGNEGHSCGHMPLEKFISTWLRVSYPAWYAAARIEGDMTLVDTVIGQMVGDYLDSVLHLYRVVFWFDN